jgi:hypothetical protein
MTRAIPAARPFHEWLENRESKFTREDPACRQRYQDKAHCGSPLACFEEELCRQRKHMTRERAFADVMKVMTRSFERVASCVAR